MRNWKRTKTITIQIMATIVLMTMMTCQMMNRKGCLYARK